MATDRRRQASRRLSSSRHTSDEMFVDDDSIAWLYQPHMLTALVAVFVGLSYVAFTRESDAASTFANAKTGLLGVVLIFWVICMMVLPNGPFVRPHTSFWRIVLGTSILYLLVLVFFLFQSREDARLALVFFQEDLTWKRPTAEEYAGDCTFSFQAVWSHFGDVYFLSHFVGWIIKAILIRNGYICWMISLAWELTEWKFTTLLPNFAECLWDQLLLDVLLCNGGGIWVGLKICKFFEMRRYNWTSIKHIRPIRGKVQRAAMQFTPRTWEPMDWDMFTNYKRYLTVYLFVMIMQLVDLNTFFLKHILAVPTVNAAVGARLLLWSLLGAPGIRQFFVYATDPTCKRLGTQCWTGGAILLTETLVIVKFGRQVFAGTDPVSLVGYWLLVNVPLLFVGTYLVRWRIQVKKRRAAADAGGRQVEAVATGSPVALAGVGSDSDANVEATLSRAKKGKRAAVPTVRVSRSRSPSRGRADSRGRLSASKSKSPAPRSRQPRSRG